jgi:soluble lytic murein transglycosylase
MMRVMENMQVYRARLNGGSAPLTPSADLARGTPPNSGPRAYQP